MKYEQKFKELNEERDRVINGLKIVKQSEYLQEYDARANKLTDMDYYELQVNAVDENVFNQMQELWLKGFWYHAMKNHPRISKLLHEMDKEVLMHLTDIQTKLHKEGHGFDLMFFFGPNAYFQDSVIIKKYILHKPEVIEEVVGHMFLWQEGDYTPVKYQPKASILSDDMLSEIEARRSGLSPAKKGNKTKDEEESGI